MEFGAVPLHPLAEPNTHVDYVSITQKARLKGAMNEYLPQDLQHVLLQGVGGGGGCSRYAGCIFETGGKQTSSTLREATIGRNRHIPRIFSLVQENWNVSNPLYTYTEYLSAGSSQLTRNLL